MNSVSYDICSDKKTAAAQARQQGRGRPGDVFHSFCGAEKLGKIPQNKVMSMAFSYWNIIGLQRQPVDDVVRLWQGVGLTRRPEKAWAS